MVLSARNSFSILLPLDSPSSQDVTRVTSFVGFISAIDVRVRALPSLPSLGSPLAKAVMELEISAAAVDAAKDMNLRQTGSGTVGDATRGHHFFEEEGSKSQLNHYHEAMRVYVLSNPPFRHIFQIFPFNQK